MLSFWKKKRKRENQSVPSPVDENDETMIECGMYDLRYDQDDLNELVHMFSSSGSSSEECEGLLDMMMECEQQGTPPKRVDTALTVTNARASSSSSSSSTSSSSSSSSGSRSSKGGSRKWTPQEDTFIRNAVAADGEWGWVKMAEHLNRTGDQCMYRWRRVREIIDFFYSLYSQ